MSLRSIMQAIALLAVGAALIGNSALAQTDDQKARALVSAYPNVLKGFDGTSLIWKDGTKMPFRDGKDGKSTGDLVNAPDIRDMFNWRYQFGAKGLPVENGADPGRVRSEAFFEKMYGACDRMHGKCDKIACKSRRTLVKMPWVPAMDGGVMQVTTVNGVDKALKAVSDDLERLGPGMRKYLAPNGGSYNARCIAGTSRISVHSFGIAFDLNTAYGQYWQYGMKKGITEAKFETMNKPLHYNNKIPIQIVEVFEKHGFIWGGKWYHFDGMHFEYRPEFKALEAIIAKEQGS